MTRTLLTAIFLTLFSQTAWADHNQKNSTAFLYCERVPKSGGVPLAVNYFVLEPTNVKASDNGEEIFYLYHHRIHQHKTVPTPWIDHIYLTYRKTLYDFIIKGFLANSKYYLGLNRETLKASETIDNLNPRDFQCELKDSIGSALTSLETIIEKIQTETAKQKQKNQI